jgi:Flp pilus assembly protein TadG
VFRVHPKNDSQAGQTILLAALSMVALMAMAALAIDVVTLYVARTEAQRSADAAALAGAQAFVSSGYTSYPSGYSSTGALCNGSTGVADLAARASAQNNLVEGVAPDVVTSCNFTVNPNPQITVRVSRSNLPTFFARIWGIRSTQVSATATAEAYNPSSSGAATPVPIQVAGVTPWLAPNCEPSTSGPPNTNCTAGKYFVDPTNGSIVNGGSFIGQPVTITLGDGSGSWNGTGRLVGPATFASGTTLGFFPIVIPNNPPTLSCPSTNQAGCNNAPGPYYSNISCFNPYQFSCGQQVFSASSPPAQSVYPDDRLYSGFLQSRTDQGTQCRIHAGGAGPNQGQDIFSTPVTPGQSILIQPGANNPNPSVAAASYISRSDSVVTIPLFDGSNLCPSGTGHVCTGTTTVVGFLQLGIVDDSSSATGGTVDAFILNASACRTGAGGTAVSGGDISPIPVRLVQPR